VADIMPSLLTRAKRLQVFARAERSDKEATQDQERTTLALGKLGLAVTELASALKTYNALQTLGVELPPLPDLGTAPTELREHINSVGRPTFTRLNGAATRVSRATGSILDDLNSRWRPWAVDRIEELPDQRIPRLAPALQRQVEIRLASLRSDARTAPSAGSATQFKLGLEWVHDVLSQVAVHSLLEEALIKVMGASRITLAELSDDEIKALRDDPTIAAQIVLSRR
jgi:hypothetical protein